MFEKNVAIRDYCKQNAKMSREIEVVWVNFFGRVLFTRTIYFFVISENAEIKFQMKPKMQLL